LGKRPYSEQLMNPHRAAALAYAALGVLVILITFAADLVPEARGGAVWQLLIGAIFLLAFAVLLYWRSWWLLSAFLVPPNIWRATNYVGLGIGLHVDSRTLSITSVSPRPIAFVNAALMTVIVLLLARSAWIGFSEWRARHRIGEES
jgi:hypothetical protein